MYSPFDLPLIKEISFDGTNTLSNIEFDHIEQCNEQKLVSVIMSAYNAEETVKYSIESLLNQSYRNIEILVCDDQSTDRTFEILSELAKKDDRLKIFQSRENQGTYNIRNCLIKKAKGEYITFQDSDDISIPSRIEKQVKSLIKSNKPVCFSRWIRIKPDGKFIFFFDGILKRFCVVSAMVERHFFSRLSEFRESLVAADTEFYEQCKNVLGENGIVNIDKPLLIGLWGDGSLTKKENLTAENSGFVASRRREYSEIAARQRLLGEEIITDADISVKLRNLDIYRKPMGINHF